MPLQNFIARALPTISAAWLNTVDVLKFTVFNDATTKAAARAALELSSQIDAQGVDSGAANAAVVTLTGPVTGYTRVTGSTISFTPIAVNTGAATLNVNATGAAAIINQLGNALTGGELSFPVTVVWTGTAWRIVDGSISTNLARTTAETAIAVMPVDFTLRELDQSRYSANNASQTNWSAVYGQIVAFSSDEVMEKRLAFVRPEWFAVGYQITSGVTDASPPIQAAVNFLNTRNRQGTSSIGFGRGTLLFDTKVYLCHSTMSWLPFINYVGIRASTPNTEADFGNLGASRGTIIRAHTDIFTNTPAGLGVLIYLQTGDMTIRNILFVGTAMITVNSSIGLQFGSTGGVATSGRPFETDGTGSVVSGMLMEGCTFNSFTQAWELNWIEDSFFWQTRFENSTNNMIGRGNALHNTKVQFELFGSIAFNHTQNFAVSAQPAGRTVAYQIKYIGGYLYSILNNVVHFAVQTTAAGSTPVNIDLELHGVNMTHTGTGSRHFLWNANWDNMFVRLKMIGGWMTGASSLFGSPAGVTPANNIHFQDVDGFNTTITFNVAKFIRINGGLFDNSILSLVSTTNWHFERQLFRNLAAGNAIDVTNAGCGNGRIIRPTFDNVTNRITIFNNATNATIEITDPIGYTTTPAVGTIRNFNPGVTFANLGTPSNGSIVFCPDGTIANPVAGAGTGCMAKRLNGVWVGN